jgi:DMSO/TMAO reductase YedYZ molybdopterin-dependent catalytic subunit
MKDEIDRLMAQKTRRSLLTGGAAALTGLGAWAWLVTRDEDNGVHWPLRRGLQIDEKLSRAYFSGHRLAPEFPLERAAVNVRTNSDIGNSPDTDRAAWKVRVEGSSASAGPVEVPLAEIEAFPRAEHVTELKCIEGWSEIVHWGGVRFADFANRYPPAAGMRYVSMETPDGEYYVGLDMESAMHPQTLLCFEMSGQRLTEKHGAPLRLCIPTKYGIKNIKQLGKIAYTKDRPDDYWAERGYDWYAGL